jgi:hypothetical protein
LAPINLTEKNFKNKITKGQRKAIIAVACEFVLLLYAPSLLLHVSLFSVLLLYAPPKIYFLFCWPLSLLLLLLVRADGAAWVRASLLGMGLL